MGEDWRKKETSTPQEPPPPMHTVESNLDAFLFFNSKLKLISLIRFSLILSEAKVFNLVFLNQEHIFPFSF